jgi:DNA repair exonuclease SbcCD nuclease subunit
MTAPFSFVHCADLHLDSPFEGLHRVAPEIHPRLREATFRAWDRVIDLAISQDADFLIVAGDVHDGENRSLQAQLKFRQGLVRAAESGRQCFVAHGNHDPLSGWEARLTMPAAVVRFQGEKVERHAVRRRGETLAEIYGLSYPVREVKTNLAGGFRRQRPGPFAIGVLHANVGGDPHHDNYAPCTLEDLGNSGMDYWALGHIHAQRILRAQAPCVIYPGNTQGRNWREMGPRGCYLVQVDERGGISPQFVATDVVRWFLRELDLGGLETWDALLDSLFDVREEVRAAAAGRGAILRVRLTGRGELHRDLLRRIDPERDLAAPLQAGEANRADFVWVEAVQNRTRPPLDLEQRRGVQDFVGDFLNAAALLREQDQPRARLLEILRQRPEHRVIARQLESLSQEELLEILAAAEALGLDQLLPEDE